MTKINRISNKVNIGDRVSFYRKNKLHEGIVYQKRENSALVEISEESKLYLDYANNKTVVGHRNYSVLNSIESNQTRVI